MEIARVIINGNEARAIDTRRITKGMRGATIRVEYADPMWDGLAKLVVFEGATDAGFLHEGEIVEVPPEVLAESGGILRFGVCGKDADGSVVIPTVWAELGQILDGVPTDVKPPSGASPSLWMQILGMIGDLKALDTEAKDNLVNAVNEVLGKVGTGGGGGSGVTFTPHLSEDGWLSWTNDGGLENPAPVNIIGPAGPEGPVGPQGGQGIPGEKGEPGVCVLADGETIEDAPADATVVIDPNGEPEEEPGTDISLNVSGATPGQIVKIAAVDEAGTPTAWEAVDMPSGGGGWELVSDTILSEDISQLEYTDLDCIDLRVAIFGRWNDADNGASNADLNANILLNNTGNGYQYANGIFGYVRTSGGFHTLVEAKAANMLVPKVTVSILSASGNAAKYKDLYCSAESVNPGNSWRDGGVSKIDRIFIAPTTSGMMLKAGARIIVTKRC